METFWRRLARTARFIALALAGGCDPVDAGPIDAWLEQHARLAESRPIGAYAESGLLYDRESQAGIMVRLETSLVTAIRKQEKVYSDDAGLLEAIDTLASDVQALPDDFSVDLVYGDPRTLWPGAAERWGAILETVDSRLNYLLYVTAAVARSLRHSIVVGLNERDYLRCILAARAQLEFAAVVHHTVPGVVETYASLSEAGDFVASMRVLADTAQKLDAFTRRTRFDWTKYVEDALAKPPSQPVKGPRESVESLVNALPQQPAGNLYAHYRLMCDFVHPSIGMQNLFISRVDACDIPRGKVARYFLSRDSAGDELFGLVLHVIGIPTREGVRALSVYINALRRVSLAHRSLLEPSDTGTFEGAHRPVAGK